LRRAGGARTLGGVFEYGDSSLLLAERFELSCDAVTYKESGDEWPHSKSGRRVQGQSSWARHLAALSIAARTVGGGLLVLLSLLSMPLAPDKSGGRIIGSGFWRLSGRRDVFA
jgi:hypothetical protein